MSTKNDVSLDTVELYTFKKELESCHYEVADAGVALVNAFGLLEGVSGATSEAIKKYIEFFKSVEKDVIKPSLVYSHQLQVGLEMVLNKIIDYDI